MLIGAELICGVNVGFEIVEETTLNQNTISIEPAENSLIVFRSYLGHMVNQGTNNDDRISVAFNF
jgi:Rps23 Pro-64 3,4-dihydroxylase Tpa1-like proline 4-hydroxylase